MENSKAGYESTSYQPEETEHKTEINRQRGQMASEAIKINRNKAKKALRNIVAGACAVGFVAGFVVGGMSNEAKHNQVPVTKEKYEAEVGDFLALKDDSNIEYLEDGSVKVTYNDNYKNRQAAYSLYDTDGDTKFENGTVRVEDNVAGASFNSEDGFSIDEAHGQLNSKLAQNIVS